MDTTPAPVARRVWPVTLPVETDPADQVREARALATPQRYPHLCVDRRPGDLLPIARLAPMLSRISFRDGGIGNETFMEASRDASNHPTALQPVPPKSLMSSACRLDKHEVIHGLRGRDRGRRWFDRVGRSPYR